MTGDNFDRAFEYVLRNEGGYSNHKADSGGATKYGITLATLERWRGLECTEGEVQTLDRTEAKEIYRAWYWGPLKLDSVAQLVVATVIFDAAILFGIPTVAVRIQNVLSQADPMIHIDGIIGSKSLAVLNRMTPEAFIAGFQIELRVRISDVIRDFPKNEVFRDGWLTRVNRFTSLIA